MWGTRRWMGGGALMVALAVTGVSSGAVTGPGRTVPERPGGDRPARAVDAVLHKRWAVDGPAYASGGRAYDWTVDKSSSPAPGAKVRPGDVITYTLTARPSRDDARDVLVTDDLLRVLNHAAPVRGSIRAGGGTASLEGAFLTWKIPKLTGPETLTYRVRVRNDARGMVLRNVVEPGEHGFCRPYCTTGHPVPYVRPRDAGLGAPFTGTAAALLTGLAPLLVAAGAFWWARRRRA